MKKEIHNNDLARYNVQMAFGGLKKEGQIKLMNSNITIVGAGALGCATANNLARSGVGEITIIDRDYVELENLQRQTLFDEKDAEKKLPKALAVKEKIKKINSAINIEALVCDLNSKNVENLFKGTMLVLDATDNFYTRFLINDACIKLNIPWIYAAVVASFGITMNIIPGDTACFSCLVPELPAPGEAPTCQTAGVLNTIVEIIASFQSTEAVKLLAGKKHLLRKSLLFLDVWENYFSQTEISKDKNCPTCAKRKFQFLEGKKDQNLWTLCGRNAVQIIPPSKIKISLKNLANELKKISRTELVGNSIIHFNVDKYFISIFSDGRAIIKGAESKEEAKSIYSRYIGT